MLWNNKLKAARVVKIRMIKKKGLDECLGLCRVAAIEEVISETIRMPKTAVFGQDAFS